MRKSWRSDWVEQDEVSRALLERMVRIFGVLEVRRYKEDAVQGGYLALAAVCSMMLMWPLKIETMLIAM